MALPKFDQLQFEARQRWREIAEFAGVSLAKAKKMSRAYVMSSPLPGRADKNPSFRITHSGPSAGNWRDYGSDEKGDILDLVVAMGVCSQKELRRWAAEYLGHDVGDKTLTKAEREVQAEERRQLAEARRRQEIQWAASEEKRIKANRGRAKGDWVQMSRDFEGTAAATYLTVARAIPVKLSDMPGPIRFAPELRHFHTKEMRPAICSQISGPRGEFLSMHRIFLEPDGSGKYRCPEGFDEKLFNPRLSWPEYAGGVIRINKGEPRLSPEQAAAKGHRGPVIICEGVEDGLALRAACPEFRIWAAVSLSNLINLPDHPCISEFIVCQDNDWAKPQAVAAFDAAIERLAGFGKPVRVSRAHIGKDANDVLKAGQLTGDKYD